MKTFFADLHIHSRYSRATSKSLNLRKLAAWGGIKGLDIIATGDFTHPGWLQEIESELIQEDSGLLSLKQKSGLCQEIPWYQGNQVPVETKFILGTEISSIYKKAGQVRKIHNLVFFPGLEQVHKFNQRLGQVGNLNSDGRPILGLDARDLLEMVLDIHPQAFLIPAHIWTPWFSLFGSKSGFNDIHECYEDLSSEIFALETGLSSDPKMNWLWSKLDKFTLVSNSDAHSGAKLARECNRFLGEPGYNEILQALKQKPGSTSFLGTNEFFSEEGKYFLDGHRKCNIVLRPEQSRKLNNICPVCARPLTLGVLNRITRLADRQEARQPAASPGFCSLIPLPEILSEILQKGDQTKTVYNMYAELIYNFGSELYILQNLPIEQLEGFSPLLARGIKRMREQKVFRQPGFDGQFGRISVFDKQEVEQTRQGLKFINKKTGSDKSSKQQMIPVVKEPEADLYASASRKNDEADLNPEQMLAVNARTVPMLVIAGPGTGKTRTLISRIIYLLEYNNPEEILVLTFTRAAARELKQRLTQGLGENQSLPRTDTLHSIAFDAWCSGAEKPVLLSEQESKRVFELSNPELKKNEVEKYRKLIFYGRETMNIPLELQTVFKNYQDQKIKLNMVDYTDLLEFWHKEMQNNQYKKKFSHVLVDEIQDLSLLQAEILRQLVPENGQGIFGIGDPEQSIYAFRGAITNFEQKFRTYWPELKVVGLEQNYRSRQNLLDFSAALFPEKDALKANIPGKGQLFFYQAANSQQEAIQIAKQIKKLIGGTAHVQADNEDQGGLAPGEIAVLFRLKTLMVPVARELNRFGLPCYFAEEARYWKETRIKIILQIVLRFLGLKPELSEDLPQCPDSVIVRGPKAFQEFFQDRHPFNALFWKSKEFKELSSEFNKYKDWRVLINQINLETDLAAVHEKAQKVHLLTLHAAKGLEFSAVFLPGLEQGILPFAGHKCLFAKDKTEQELQIPIDKAEEKRLFYVGLTRASQYIYLSRADKRQIYGQSLNLEPSEFLKQLNWENVKITRSVSKKRRKETQAKLL